ncbi:MAG: Crp/Fnr family transcriptional regulator [Treponema sp.]|jgi:CRP/FNR family transcriptional regulator|nr:Crp/Fnr family transcriptional regulator [Treponema sp.]
MQSSESLEYFFSTHLTFWDNLSPTEKRYVAAGTSEVFFKKGTTLRTDDRNCLGLMIIKSGFIRVYMLSPEGRDITLFRIKQGDVCILSASCVLNQINFEVSMDAEADTSVYMVRTPVYREISDHNIYVREFGYEVAARRFSEVMWAMQQILFMSFDKRLAIFLLEVIDRQQENTVKMTHEEIAKNTGSAREVVTRMLNYFASEKIVVLSRGSITVINEHKLREIAGDYQEL